jgi:small-conductance mechanosensitive channel
MHPPKRSAALLIALLLLPPAELPAQFGALSKAAGAGKSEEAAKPTPETPDQARKRLTEMAAAWQAEADRLSGDFTPPPGISANEVADRRSYLLLGVFGAERTMRALDTSGSLRETLERAKKADAEWQGFDKPGPYSFLLHDELQRQQEAAAGRLSAYDSAAAMIDRQIAGRLDEIRQAEEALRRAKDAADRAGEADRPAARWRVDAAAQRVKALGQTATLYQFSRDNTQLRVATARAELELARRKVAALGTEMLFPEADLAKLKESAEERGREIDREIGAIEKRQRQLVQESGKARQELAAITGETPEEKTRRDAAAQLLRALEDEVQSLSDRSEVLAARRRFTEENLAIQKARRVIVGGGSHEEKADAYKLLEDQLTRASAFDRMVDVRRNAIVAEIREQENRENPPEAGTALRAAIDRLIAARRLELDAIERFGQDVASMESDVRRWIGDADELAAAMSWRERAGALAAKARQWALKVWNFEIYEYEDREEVNGEVIPVKRGLVLGWFLGALLFFIAAYRIGSRIVRRLMDSLVAKGHAEKGQADTWRRWAMVVVAVVLALFTLHFLKIPLTAFAFLGGALAIGIGFGTQTLFKNFISGIIVLAERKVKVGDILDVDGLAGTVTSIDTRSSTVRTFDGVDVILPNSLLLENKVVNWTHESAKVRRVVRVGVAYGAPLREVTGILTECAEAHGLVAKDPAPLAVLEDFGADSLVFALFFWVDLRGGGNSTVIGSDLRFMIEKRLSEAGISIAFPQRDIHLKGETPLRVSLVRGGAAEGPATPGEP